MKNIRLLLLLGLGCLILVSDPAGALYNPNTGRWLSRDPIGAQDGMALSYFKPNGTPERKLHATARQYSYGLNLYEYVSGSPFAFSDPLGLRKSSTTSPSPSGCDVCGPDVTQQVKDALGKVEDTFNNKLSAEQKEAACDAFTSRDPDPLKGNEPMWLNAWDINNLHNQNWINSAPYSPKCATTPNCQNTVTVDGKCFYAGSANYVVFGRMWKLCDNYEWTGETLIWGYKGDRPTIKRGWLGIPYLGKKKPAANYKPSQDWFSAGYNKWPGGSGTPDADRPKCATTCTVPYAGSPFTVYWGTIGEF